MKSIALIVVAVALSATAVATSSTTLGAAQSSSALQMAFRFDDDRVLFHTSDLGDPVPRTMKDTVNAVKVTRDTNGVCGYLLPLTPDRLKTFQGESNALAAVPPIGQRVTVWLGGGVAITAQVDEYLEEWQGDPGVNVVALARATGSSLSQLRASNSDAFVVSTTPNPPMPSPGPAVGFNILETKTLNRFDRFGELILKRASAGWNITLFALRNGVSQPTVLQYDCGD